MSEKDGGPAFPIGDSDMFNRGMSLRDYFAAKAMGCAPSKTPYNMKSNETDSEFIARWSYVLADAMLKEREK